jgi:hypothetical protein
MFVRIFVSGLLLTYLLEGGNTSKKIPSGTAQNDSVEVNATLLPDRDAVKQALGSDLGGHYVVVEVQVHPRGTKPLAIHLDDFLLRTDKDGERTTPFAPTQIAGRGALVVSQTGAGGGAYGENPGPVWGGYPGSTDRPRRMGGNSPVMGNGGGETAAQATVKSGAGDKEDPLVKVLKEKILPEKETGQPVSGLLYFPMEKQKAKDLELIVTTPEGKLNLRFR